MKRIALKRTFSSVSLGPFGPASKCGRRVNSGQEKNSHRSNASRVRLSSPQRGVYVYIDRLSRDDALFVYSRRGMQIPFVPARTSLLALTLLLMLGSAQAKRAPNFEAKDLSGQAQKLSKLRGQIVVLSFWATWCRPCRELEPHFERVAARYQAVADSALSAHLELRQMQLRARTIRLAINSR